MYDPLLTTSSFEAQLAAVKERLDAVKNSRAIGSPTNGGFNFGSAGSRIAKPLRGGGGDGPTNPTISGLQNEAPSNTGKRNSWFFSGNK